MNFDEIISKLSLEDKIGQMMCFSFSNQLEKNDFEEIEKIVKETHTGGFFVVGADASKIKRTIGIVEKYSNIPCIVASDIEEGPGTALYGIDGSLPSPMAWGSCDDADLIEKAHIATAEICREAGINWNFSPIVDINMNPDNPVTNIRAISDSPKQVVKIAGAAIRGMQKNGLMAAGCKHFPGDGVDSRNQHLCTSVNSLSKEEWMNTFGYVYKELIKQGASSVMVGHIALPAYDEKLNDWVGYPPASVSYNLQTKLLREELGFDGCIVSDAMSMIGVSAAVESDRVAVEFVKAGGDIILFPLVEYFYQIRDAVNSGEIPMKRIDDAVKRVLTLKNKVRLFEKQEDVLKDIKHEYDFHELSDKIAEKAIKVVRNYGCKLPLDLKKGDKVLLITIEKDGNKLSTSRSLEIIEDEFKKRGIEARTYTNPRREDIIDDLETASAVLVNINISCRSWNGGSMRMGFAQMATLWRGVLLKHPNCVFTSFGDPYKLFEIPCAKNYINVYSPNRPSQRAFVKAILGEIPFQGKNAVTLKGFFDAEV